MEQVYFIKELVERKGFSLRKTAKFTGHDFKTVKKYVEKDNWNEVPKKRKKRETKLDKFKSIIDKWLTEDLTAKPKQRHTAKRVYDRLCDEYSESFDASYRTVRKYVSEKKKQLYGDDDGFLPLEHPGGEAQVDFGKADFIEKGIRVSGCYVTLSFPGSNGGFIQLFKGENQECLLTGIKAIFEYIGVVPYKIWFDNLSAAVTSIQKNGERKLTNGFQKFMLHYGFSSSFCNPNSGHEKGNVENKVGYLRRNLLVPIPEFNDLNEFNKILLGRCMKDMKRVHYKKDKTIRELLEEEKKTMLTLPDKPYEVCRLEKAKTDKYGKLKFDKRYTYSSSPAFTEKQVWIKATADKVIILNEEYNIITSHDRLYGNQKESMNWYPYLSLMAKRPNALKYTGFYNKLPDPLKEYFDQCKNAEKNRALKIICRIIQETDLDTAVRAFIKTLENGVSDLDSVITTYYRLSSKVSNFEDLELSDDIPKLTPYSSDIHAYDNLLRKEVC